MSDPHAPLPKIRRVDYQPYTHENQPYWLLQDPLQLQDRQLLLPPILAQATLYLDGRRSLAEVRHALLTEVGWDVPEEALWALVRDLDACYLLDNETLHTQLQAVQVAWRAQEARPPHLAGRTYPAHPTELAAALDAYGTADDPTAAAEWADWHGRAIISPHIDYQRGGDLYAKVWKRAEKAVQAADLILIFATDHRGGLGSLTLSRVPYATPYGVLPTDVALVDKLAAVLGEEVAYGLELNHRTEHSVELVAVWLHHALRGRAAPPVVPLLIGSFHHFVAQEGHPTQDEEIMAFIEALVEETRGQRVLCVASADLAHMGPAFDDDFVMDEARRAALVETDASLMAAVVQGDGERFYREIAAVGDANKVCGFSPIYLMLRYLHGRGPEPIRGHQIAYQHCPADEQNDSLVSICGLLLD